jgi:hypothetical protein
MLDQVMRTRQISPVRSSNEYYGSVSGSYSLLNGNRTIVKFTKWQGGGVDEPYNRIKGPIIEKLLPIIGSMNLKSDQRPHNRKNVSPQWDRCPKSHIKTPQAIGSMIPHSQINNLQNRKYGHVIE